MPRKSASGSQFQDLTTRSDYKASFYAWNLQVEIISPKIQNPESKIQKSELPRCLKLTLALPRVDRGRTGPLETSRPETAPESLHSIVSHCSGDSHEIFQLDTCGDRGDPWGNLCHRPDGGPIAAGFRANRSPTAPATRRAGGDDATVTAADKEEWRAKITHTRMPKKGCFKSSFPSGEWQEIPCAAPPAHPYRRRGVTARCGRQRQRFLGRDFEIDQYGDRNLRQRQGRDGRKRLGQQHLLAAAQHQHFLQYAGLQRVTRRRHARAGSNSSIPIRAPCSCNTG